MTPIHISTIDAKEEFSDLISRVSHHQEHIVLTRRGKEIAAIIPYDDFILLQKALRKSDLEEAIEALQEARSAGVMTLEDFKTEMANTRD